MKVKLTQRNRIDGEAGDIVEVSPERAAFLIYCGGAERIKEEQDEPGKRTPKKGGKKGK